MKKYIQLILIFCLPALLLTSCKQQIKNTDTRSGNSYITILDEEERIQEIPYQPKAIICLVPAVGEVIAALGECDKIAARSYECSFPPSVTDKTNVGSASKPNIELLLKQNPNLVIARTGTLFTDELRDKLESAGVPVIQFRSIELNTALQMTEQMGLLLDKQNEATALISFIEGYEKMIGERVATVNDNMKPLVLFQSMGHMYWSNNADTAGHRRIITSGGINIAADEPVHIPHLSAEWVLEKNPDITIYSYLDASDSGDTPCLGELEEIYNMMLSHPGFKEIEAVKNGKVYIIDSRLLTGPRSIIGLLYYAKWFHPQLFTDIDPQAIHSKMLRIFWKEELEGDWVYPAAK